MRKVETESDMMHKMKRKKNNGSCDVIMPWYEKKKNRTYNKKCV